MFYLYVLQNTITDKTYVGQSVNPVSRLKVHRHSLNRGAHQNCYLQNAWAKYGKDAFESYILAEFSSKEEVDEAEKFYIRWFKAQGLSYNNVDGGEGLCNPSAETREKIRLAHLGRPSTEAQRAALELGRDKTGFVHSEESKQKMSNAKQGWRPSPELIEIVKQIHTGRPKSEEERRKLSEANKGNQNFLGKHHTEEMKQKMSEARKGEGNPMYGKPATEERKRRLSETTKGRPGKPLTEEAKQKIREARAKQVMKPVSEETKEKIRQKANERAAKKREAKAQVDHEFHGVTGESPTAE